MRICVVQTRPNRGDIPGNIARHRRLIDLACSRGVDVIAFPELSITGYEPELARDLATDGNDPRFDTFQEISDARHVTLAVGVPTRGEPRPRISLAIFRPRQPRYLYSKRYLHPDEVPFFVPGSSSTGILGGAPRIALAICYELSVPAHAAAAVSEGADVYLASAAKTAEGVEKAAARLSAIARRFAVDALLANCVGRCGGADCAGKSAVWNRRGELLAQLDDAREGLILLDTAAEEAVSLQT
jgi:predicted amidohydrolase